MTYQHACGVIARIRLVRGMVQICRATAGDVPNYISVAIGIEVKERGGGLLAKPILIQTVHTIFLEPIVADEELLRSVQSVWTSLWMHESLENFMYNTEGPVPPTLPFNPHCKDSITPKAGTFLMDDSCEVIFLERPVGQLESAAVQWQWKEPVEPSPLETTRGLY